MNVLLETMLSNALFIVPIAFVVALVARFLKRPAVAHCLWLILLVKLLAPIGFEVDWPVRSIVTGVTSSRWRDDALSAKTTVAEPVTRQITNKLSSLDVDSSLARLEPSPNSIDSTSDTPSLVAHANSLTTILKTKVVLGSWLVGNFSFVCLLLYRARRFHRFASRAPLADESVQAIARSIARRYQLRTAPDVRVANGDFPPLLWVGPQAASVIVPRVLLKQLDSNAMRNVLAHELAHFARGDHWVRVIESLVLAVYWWHPLVWWVRRQLQHAEEQCCDAWALWAYPNSQTDYARTLLATLDYLSEAKTALPPLASGLGRSNLVKRRFEMILHHKPPRKLSGWGAATALVLGIMILPWSTSVIADEDEKTEAAQVEINAALERAIELQVRKRMEEVKREANALKQARKQQREKVEKVKEQAKAHKEKTKALLEERLKSAMMQKDALRRHVETTVRQALKDGMHQAKVQLERAQLEAAKANGEAALALDSTFELMNGLDKVSETQIEEVRLQVEEDLEEARKAIEDSAIQIREAVETGIANIDIDAELDDVDRDIDAIDLEKDTVDIRLRMDANVPVSVVVSQVEKALEDLKDVDVQIEVREEKKDQGAAKATLQLDKARRRAPKVIRNLNTATAKAAKSVERKLSGDAEVDSILRQIEALTRQLETLTESPSGGSN